MISHYLHPTAGCEKGGRRVRAGGCEKSGVRAGAKVNFDKSERDCMKRQTFLKVI